MTMPILLMTRPHAAAKRFVARLDPDVIAKVEVIFAPLIKIVPTQVSPRLGPDEGAIFTSTHGVAFAPDGAGRAAYCVGKGTAERATARGWQVALCAQDADELVACMPRHQIKGHLHHLAGRYRRGDVAERLAKMGLNVSVSELYDQVLLPLNETAHAALSGEATVIVPLFSARSAAQFGSEAGTAPNVLILAMSAAVADALKGTFVGKVQVALLPTGDEMRQGIENVLRGHSLP